MATLVALGLDYAGALIESRMFEFPANRTDYAERRITTAGYLGGCMVIVVWIDRPPERHVISMRKGNAREQRRCALRLD